MTEANGDAELIVSVPVEFCEGIGLMNNELVQLTWLEQTTFRYNPATLEQPGTFSYEGQGWGMCSTPGGLLMSNGTERVSFRDCQFNVIRTLDISIGDRYVNQLNDLEYVDGRIYANVFTSDFIVRIDPGKSCVDGLFDCSELVEETEPANEEQQLSGIATIVKTVPFFTLGASRMRTMEYYVF